MTWLKRNSCLLFFLAYLAAIIIIGYWATGWPGVQITTLMSVMPFVLGACWMKEKNVKP